jgi:molybdate transport system substrate-binding protein
MTSGDGIRRGASRILLALLALAFALLSPVPQVAAQDALVFAAASLKEALDDVADAYASQGGGKVSVSYAASSALARQIEAGAPADIFISADKDWMDHLQESAAIRPRTRSDLLGNRLVLVAPAGSRADLAIGPGLDLSGALGEGRLAMAQPDSVPAGKYGKAALQAFGAWEGVERRVAAAENVRAALALVSRGEAPLGIVYATDAKADPGVRVVGTFPEETHPPIVYPAAITAGSRNPEAEAFLAFMHSDRAAALFERRGFTLRDRQG